MWDKVLAVAIAGTLLAIIRIIYAKIKLNSSKKPKGYWICPNCNQKNFNSKEICGNCKTKNPNI